MELIFAIGKRRNVNGHYFSCQDREVSGHAGVFRSFLRQEINVPSQGEVMANWGEQREPEVSIICPTHNNLDQIERALIGFLRQVTNFPFEVLVRDDGSTDGTAGVVEHYSALFPKILRNLSEPSDTWGKVRHNEVLISASLAPLIAPCDGDDFWVYDKKIQSQRDYLLAHPTDSLVFHGTLEFSPDGRLIRETIVAEPEDRSGRHNGGLGFRAAWSSVMFRKAPLRPIEFPPAVVPQSDVLITHRIAQFGGVRALSSAPWTARMIRPKKSGELSRGSDYQTAVSRFILSEMLMGESNPSPKEAAHFFGEGMRRLFVIASKNRLPAVDTLGAVITQIIRYVFVGLRGWLASKLSSERGNGPNGT